MMKINKFVFIVFIIFINIISSINAQTNKICGRLTVECSTMELILFSENDSCKQFVTEKDLDFCFASIKDGVYSLLVNVDGSRCPIRTFTIKNIILRDTSLYLGQLPTFKLLTRDYAYIITDNDTLYYPSGEIQTIGKFKKTKVGKEKRYFKVGKWSNFAKNGYLSSVSYYYDQEQCYNIQYYDNGNIKAQGEKHYDTESGKWFFYNENGNKLFSIDYKKSGAYEIEFSDLEKFISYHSHFRLW